MSAVWNEAPTNEEAAEFSPEGMNATEFRHGPLKLVGCAQIQRIDLRRLACYFCSQLQTRSGYCGARRSCNLVGFDNRSRITNLCFSRCTFGVIYY